MVILPMLLALAALVLVTGAEWLHVGRVRRVAALAFGPGKKPGPVGRAAPFVRIAALPVLVWSLVVLLLLPPAAHRAVPLEVPDADKQHLLLVLDVSPSMRLHDAGPTGKESRMDRARAIVESIISRIAQDKLHTTVVAVYNGAKPVVKETRDLEIVHNLMDNLPMQLAFTAGKTRLLDGLTEAAEMAAKWPRGSATLVLISDGDSVPAAGMPKMPPSVGGVLVAGVGDPLKGIFIDGHQSRQDGTTLRQIATRLGGEYHDGNAKLVPTAMLQRLGTVGPNSVKKALSLRELALAMGVTSCVALALLPVLLHLFGSGWNPGPRAVAAFRTTQPELPPSQTPPLSDISLKLNRSQP